VDSHLSTEFNDIFSLVYVMFLISALDSVSIPQNKAAWYKECD
jgi:hypothetical protein